MPKIIKKKAGKTGLAPGSLVHVGDSAAGAAGITALRYNEAGFNERVIETLDELCLPEESETAITWVNVEGLPEPGVMECIGKCFKLHSLVLEDILNTDHRPKMEDYGEYIYITLKIAYFKKDAQEIDIEQVSIILGKNYVISFREKKDDEFFKPIRERITSGKGRLRKMKSDYLAYSIMDLIVDNYFNVLENMGDSIDVLEEMFIANPSQFTLKTFHELKREILFLRKSVWPLRELVNGLERGDSRLIGESLGIYLRDIYDHVTQIIDIIETFRDMLSGMLDIYMSSVSNRINEVMKVLTIITTIFIPLSFISGVYGMNFKYMPELGWRWGYPATLAVMGIIVIMMVVYFRKKRWM